MRLFGKKLDEFDYSLIQRLINSKVSESYCIEYKGRGFLNRKTPPKDILKHKDNIAKKIASLDKTQGGFIFLGIEEDKKQNPPVPTKISGTDIENFLGTLDSIISGLIQPSCNYEFKEINHPLDRSIVVYALEIFESEIPIMKWAKRSDNKGYFPIRIGENTEIANQHQVEMLFLKTKLGRGLRRSAQDFYNDLKKICSINSTIHQMNAIRARVSVQYKNIIPDLYVTIIPETSKTGSDMFYVLDKYLVYQNGDIFDGEKKSSSHPEIKDRLFQELKDFWKKKLNIYVN